MSSVRRFNAFVPATDSAQVRTDLKITAGLWTMFIVKAAKRLRIQPDAWQQVKMLISGNAFFHRLQPRFWNISLSLFPRLKRWYRSSATARRTIVTGFDHRKC